MEKNIIVAQFASSQSAVALPYQDSFLSSFGVGAYYQDIPSSGDTIKILVINNVYLVHVHLVNLTQIYILKCQKVKKAHD